MSNSKSVLLFVLAVLTGCSAEPARQAAPAPAATVTHTQPAATAAPAATNNVARDLVGAAAAKPSEPFSNELWQSMFDGHSLAGWRPTAFAGRGEIECQSGLLVLNMGDPFTGVNWTNDFPKVNYELALDAVRLAGSDFFCGLTVPVGDSFCSLIVGGWGGSLVGISSIEGMDASENETTKFLAFETGRWYRIRLRVTEGRIEGWIDQQKMLDVVIGDRKISLRPGEIEMSKPMGIAAWQTSAALREIRWRKVSTPADPPRRVF